MHDISLAGGEENIEGGGGGGGGGGGSSALTGGVIAAIVLGSLFVILLILVGLCAFKTTREKGLCVLPGLKTYFESNSSSRRRNQRMAMSKYTEAIGYVDKSAKNFQ